MFQAETVSGLCRANSGFCTTVVIELQNAEPRISSAPASILRSSPSPSAISPMPANDTAVPSHAPRPKRSPRTIMASAAVMIGLTLMMKLAGPDDTVCSPRLSRVV